MFGRVVNLFTKTGDQRHNSVKDMLAIAEAKEAKGDYGKNPGAMLIIWDRDGGDYKTSYDSAGMTASQAVALLEVIKYRILQEKIKEPK